MENKILNFNLIDNVKNELQNIIINNFNNIKTDTNYVIVTFTFNNNEKILLKKKLKVNNYNFDDPTYYMNTDFIKKKINSTNKKYQLLFLYFFEYSEKQNIYFVYDVNENNIKSRNYENTKNIKDEKKNENIFSYSDNLKYTDILSDSITSYYSLFFNNNLGVDEIYKNIFINQQIMKIKIECDKNNDTTKNTNNIYNIQPEINFIELQDYFSTIKFLKILQHNIKKKFIFELLNDNIKNSISEFYNEITNQELNKIVEKNNIDIGNFDYYGCFYCKDDLLIFDNIDLYGNEIRNKLFF